MTKDWDIKYHMYTETYTYVQIIMPTYFHLVDRNKGISLVYGTFKQEISHCSVMMLIGSIHFASCFS